MPILFLEAVNDTLKRAGVIQGATGELSTGTGATASEIFLSRSDIQHPVDIILQMWREAAHTIYELSPASSLVATATVVLVADQREYTLPDDFERIAGKTNDERVLRGATNALILKEYPGGYIKMLADQPVATDWTGDPGAWALSPRNRALRLDRDPTSDIAGETYNLAYERRIDLTATMATATMPFSDTVAFALVPVVAEYYDRSRKKEFDASIFRAALARAAGMAQGIPPKDRYGVRRM